MENCIWQQVYRYCSYCCIRSTRERGGWVRKTQTTDTQTMLSQLAVADCALHRLSLYPSKILNIRIQRQLKSVLICFIEFITKVLRKRWANIVSFCKNYILPKNKTTDAEELEKLAASQDFEVERHESTLKSYPKSMIQQLNCYLNMMEIELSSFFADW